MLIGGLVAGVVLIVPTAVERVQEVAGGAEEEYYYPEWEPLHTGEPGSPVAADPLECPSQCLTYRQVDETALTQEDLFALGLTVEDEEAGVGSAYPAGSELSYYAGSWKRGDYAPDECFPISIPEPIVAALGDDLESPTDRIYFVSAYSDRNLWDYVFQSARFFESSDAATEHMTSMSTSVADCTHYSAVDAEGLTWEADITPAPAVAVPDGVAAVGWQEDSSAYRYYAFDLQRGNLVVRTTLLVYGGTPEDDFRAAVESVALRLGELQPLEG